jgi:hypothetical protein
MEKKPEKENSNYSGLVAAMMMAGILIFTGTVKICIPSVLNREFIIAGSGMIILWGIAMAVRYFVKSEYNKAGNYDLALGILCTAAGAAVFLYASELEIFLSTVLAIDILISGVIIFQQAIQDIQLHGYLFVLQFLLAVAVTGFSIILLFFPDKWVIYDSVLYWSLIISSGAALILSQIFIGIRLTLWRVGKKREEMKEKDNDDDLIKEFPDKVPVYKDDGVKEQTEPETDNSSDLIYDSVDDDSDDCQNAELYEDSDYAEETVSDDDSNAAEETVSDDDSNAAEVTVSDDNSNAAEETVSDDNSNAEADENADDNKAGN